MFRGLTRGQLAAAGLVLLAAAWLVAWPLAASAGGRRWAPVLEASALDLKHGLSPVLILVGNAAKPVLILFGLVMGLVCLRRSWRSAVVFGAIVVLVNASVQLVKHPLVLPTPELAGLNPLSGHVGLVGAVCFGWLVAGPRSHQALSVAATLVAVVGVSAGVVIAGWHTPAQVLCCLMIGVGWALLGSAALGEQKAAASPSGERRLGGWLVLVGLASASVGWCIFALWSAGSPQRLVPESVMLAVAVGGGMGAAALGAVLALTSGWASRHPREAAEPSATTAEVGAVGSRT